MARKTIIGKAPRKSATPVAKRASRKNVVRKGVAELNEAKKSSVKRDSGKTRSTGKKSSLMSQKMEHMREIARINKELGISKKKK